MKTRPSLQTLAPAILALWLFTGLAAYHLTLPGLHADEAQEAGLQAEQILAGAPVTAFRGATVGLAGLTFPLMVQDYIGALNVILALPFLAALGPSVFALRLMTVSVGLVTIALTYAGARQVFGARPAAWAALLLAVQPSFVFWSRQGVFVTSITAALAMACLWALAAWARRPRRWRRLALAGCLAGLGVYAKLLFLWIIGGITLTGALYLALQVASRKWSLGQVARTALRPAISTGLWFLLGVSPLVVYNVKTGGTLASVGGNLTTSFYGVNNLDIARNLATRLDQLRAVLGGRDHLWYLGGSFGNPATEWLLLGALAVIVLRAATRRPGWRGPLALALLTLFAFLQTVFTVSGLFPTHFAVLMPLFPLLIAVGADGLAVEVSAAPRHAPAEGPRSDAEGAGRLYLALTVLILGTMARDVWVDANYHTALENTGGLNAHSDAVVRLAAYLDELPDHGPVVALDWGFAPSVKYLTQGRVAPDEIFGYISEPDEDFEARMAAYLEQPDALFIVHWPQEEIFPRRAAFEAALAARGLRAVTLETFSRRDGAPIFDVVRVEP